MSVFKKISGNQIDLRSSISMSFEAAQTEMLMEQQQVNQLNDELQKTMQVKQAVGLVSDSLDPNDRNYGVAMEAIFIASGLNLPAELLAPSFEAEDKKEDAGEKKQGFMKRAWEAIKAFLKKLWDGFLRLIGRKKEVVEKIAEIAEEMAQEAEAAVPEADHNAGGEKKADPKEPASRASKQGPATLAGKTSQEFVENAPRILREFGAYYDKMIATWEAVGQARKSQMNGIQNGKDGIRVFKLDGLNAVIKGGSGFEHSVKFLGTDRGVTAEIKDNVTAEPVTYMALSPAARKKIGKEMAQASKEILPTLAAIGKMKQKFDMMVAELGEMISNDKLKEEGIPKAAAEIAVSVISATIKVCNNNGIDKLGSALITIRSAGRKAA